MRILNSIKDNETIVGYRVEDGTFVLPLCKKALYLDMYIAPLIADGYKYYGYDADLIEDASGTPISELPAVQLSEQDDMEWAASINLADQAALSDAEASRYYSYRETSVVQFRTEDSYEINTREELVQYLLGLERALFTASFSTDNRPLNAFVNPEALFTINELANDPDVRRYFGIIIKRHRMRNYTAYRSLVTWLQEKGVLNTDNPSVSEFLSAYYAWGPEGIKDKCTDYNLKLAVDGVFEFMKDPLYSGDPIAYMTANRSIEVVVVDGNDTMHFLKKHESLTDISDVKEFSRSRIAVTSNDRLLAIRRRNQNGKKYMAITGTMVSDVSDRMYFTLITEDGYTYTYKVSHNKIKIGLTHTNTNSEVFSYSDNFGFASLTPSVIIPMDVVANETDYYLWNLAILKSAQLIEKKSKKAPYSSTTEYLLADGVSPVATVDMMAHAITKDTTHQSNRRYEIKDKEDDLIDALEIYMQDIPEYILQAYQIAPEDITEGMQSLLELADVDDLEDRRDSMMSMRIGPNDPGFDPTFKDYSTKVGRVNASVASASAALGVGAKMIDAVDYLTKIKFVDDCIHGNLSVNNFGDGILDDMGASYMVAARCMLSTVYAEYGDTPDKEQAKQAILYMEDGDLIDIEKIFKMRDSAWKGYMVDYAEYRKMRASGNAWIWAYCTKVFREISNAPVAKQRPYLMELAVLENNKQDMPTRELMTACVSEAISKAGLDDTRFDTEGLMQNWSVKNVAMSSADYIAARVFFFIMAGGCKSEPVNGVYTIPMKLQEGIELNIDIPVEVYNFVKGFNVASHKRYITVYDFCKYEYNPNTKNGTFNICLVNADVDPWHVKPKAGYSIKTYPLLPNYHDQSALDTANGEGFYLTARNNGGICVQPLRTLYRSLFIPISTVDEMVMYEELSKRAQSYTDLEEFLYPDQYEYIFAYVRRWALAKKLATAQGKKLLSIPLKQDIVYSELAYSYCDELPSKECVFVDDDLFDDKQCQKVSDVTKMSWKDNDKAVALLTTRSVSVHPFSLKDIDVCNIESMEAVIDGSFISSIPVVISGNYLVVKDDKMIKVPVSRIQSDQIEQFVSDGVVLPIGNNKYFVSAINGDYVLEV